MLTESGLGGSYTLMGGAWDTTRPISFSFVPDGAAWDQGTNNINARLDAEYGNTNWQGEIARALQTWAVASNLDFTQVGDSGVGFNAAGDSQGDPQFGDIRIGGTTLATPTTIARTYGPPPNGSSGAGDVELNTTYDFTAGSRYSLQTILLHEFGHSLGLGESPKYGAVMYGNYSGPKTALTADDIAGIQSIYGPRQPDRYQATGLGTTADNAIDLTSSLDASHQAELAHLSLDAIGDAEYFAVVAPAITGATLRVSANAAGSSLLSPKVGVIDAASGTVLATDAQPAAFGDDVTVSVPGVEAGHRYLIAVTGATSDVFAVGSYTLRAEFAGGTPINSAPAPTPVPVATPDPTPVATAPVVVPAAPAPVAAIPADRFAASTWFTTAADLGVLGRAGIGGLTLPTAQTAEFFRFTVAQAGTVWVAVGGAKVIVGDELARPVAGGTGLFGFEAPTAGATYYLIFQSADGQASANYQFAVNVVPNPVVVPPVAPVAAIPTTSTARATPTPTASKSIRKVKQVAASHQAAAKVKLAKPVKQAGPAKQAKPHK